ncbi:MAG: enoyl-CoA hydratase-related protein [Actinomycetota bacterium]|nr:enoyl-CoA hydratase-related protein [Actinomycetota bacterium]
MPVHADVNGPVLEITLDRPKANAIDRETGLALHDAFARLRGDPELRVGIFTAAGERFFSAGWDLKAAAAGDEDPSTDFGPGGFAGFTEMFDLDKPVIAAVNGMAVGGGFEMVLACDLIVAAEHVEFFLPELSVGIVPDAGGVQRLPSLLPRAVANDLILTSRRMGAAEAQSWGLVRSVVPGNRLMGEARELAERVAAAAPLATQATKQVLRGIAGMDPESSFAAMREGSFPAYDRALASDEAGEGAAAFAEGRPAHFE